MEQTNESKEENTDFITSIDPKEYGLEETFITHKTSMN